MMKVQILGTGCPKYKKLAENAQAAVQAAGLALATDVVNGTPPGAD